MKKILFVLFVILLNVIHSNAQTSIATLSHDGEIKAFYGSNALIEAYEAAKDGDVISLSAGLFNSVDIAKAITLRGSGCDNDASTGRQATYLTGDFTLSKSENSDNPIVIEGIYNNNDVYCSGEGLKVQILKVRLKRLLDNVYIVGDKNQNQYLILINSRITERFDIAQTSNATCINSIIQDPVNGSNSSIEFKNCFVSLNYNYDNENCFFDNCIIYSTRPIYINNIVNNCIGGGNRDLFNDVQGGNNAYLEDLSSIFGSYSQEVNDVATYELTDEAKTQYIGNDGTEVGIYGGMWPYSTTPSSPQITKFKVAEKSTADGKLRIDIKINMPQ